MKKVIYISGTRADYGLMKSVLKAIDSRKDLDLEICATGMHLMSQFGYSVNEIKKDGFRVHKIACIFNKNDKASETIFLGNFIKLLTPYMLKSKPDMMIVLGDRIEMLGAVIVGSYLQIPVLHLHGGDLSSTVDESTRHAITKLAHIHLAATEKSAERIMKIGEDPWRINVVGAPGIEYLRYQDLIPKGELEKKFNINLEKPLIMILQHPVSTEIEDAPKQIRSTIEAVKAIGHQAIMIYPNSDPGGKVMIKVIDSYKKDRLFRIFKNLEHREFVSLLKYASVLVGNSSAGIIESSAFELPVVDIGTRQLGRERACNVIECGYSKQDIIKSIKICLSKAFRDSIHSCKNPYFKKDTSKRIIRIIMSIKNDKRLIQKHLTY